MAKDHYAILGVSRTATQEEIQSAYRKMEQLYNPEANGAAFAANIYRKVTEARDVLMDEEQRRGYDAQLSSETDALPQAAAPVSSPPEPSPAPNVAPPVPDSAIFQEFQTARSTFAGKAATVSPTAAPAPTPETDQRAFYAAQFRAEKEAAFTFQDWLTRREVFIAVGGCILLIDILVWLFGLRLSPGETFGFLLRSSGLVFMGWAVYFTLRYYTDNVFFGLGYSLFYAIIYSVFLVRVYFNPALYATSSVGAQIGRQIGVHFAIFYVLFFCAAQSLEEGGLKTVYDRAVGRK